MQNGPTHCIDSLASAPVYMGPCAPTPQPRARMFIHTHRLCGLSGPDLGWLVGDLAPSPQAQRHPYLLGALARRRSSRPGRSSSSGRIGTGAGIH